MDKKGMAFMEYVLLISIILIAVLFMAIYIRRSVEGKIHEAFEGVGSRYEYGGKTISDSNTNILRNVTTNVFEIESGNKIRTETTIHSDEVNRNVNETVLY